MENVFKLFAIILKSDLILLIYILEPDPDSLGLQCQKT